jgi:hypothetical protein
VTPFAKQCIGEMGPRLRLEVFCEAELRVNITTHSMVPAHSVLTAQEKQTLLVRYKVCGGGGGGGGTGGEPGTW